MPVNNKQLKASFGSYSDYLFLEDGVLKIRIVPPVVFPAMVLAFVLLISFLTLSLPIERTIGVSGTIFLRGWIPIILALLLELAVASRKRKRLSGLSFDQIKNNNKVARLVPWKNIHSAKIRGRRISILTTEKTYTMWASKKDSPLIDQFVRTKTVSRAPNHEIATKSTEEGFT